MLSAAVVEPAGASKRAVFPLLTSLAARMLQQFGATPGGGVLSGTGYVHPLAPRSVVYLSRPRPQ